MTEGVRSVEEISDRLEINDLLVRYAEAIDSRDWKLLDTCFTTDAKVDYTSSGGIAGRYPEVRAWLEQVLALFPAYMHLIGNIAVSFEDGGAKAKTYVINPMQFEAPDGSRGGFTVAAYYHDRLVRTGDGWRIAERTEELVLTEGSLPDALTGKGGDDG